MFVLVPLQMNMCVLDGSCIIAGVGSFFRLWARLTQLGSEVSGHAVVGHVGHSCLSLTQTGPIWLLKPHVCDQMAPWV